jgi:hypothetical protein
MKVSPRLNDTTQSPKPPLKPCRRLSLTSPIADQILKKRPHQIVPGISEFLGDFSVPFIRGSWTEAAGKSTMIRKHTESAVIGKAC